MENALHQFHITLQRTTTISASTLAKIQSAHPAMSLLYLRFLGYVARTSWRDEETGGIPFSRNALGYILGKRPDKVHLIPFLQECKDTSMPQLSWIPSNYKDRKSTVITSTGLEDIILILRSDTGDGRLYMDTLRKATPRMKAQLAKELQVHALRTQWPYQAQADIANYSNALPYALFLKHDIHNATRLALDLDALDTKEAHYYHNSILAFHDMPKPFYVPRTREDSKTPRLFTNVLQSMSTPLRHALYPHWYDVDMRNCYISLIAYLFDAPRTKAFLSSSPDASFWIDVMDFMNIASERRLEAKPFIKTAIYSFLFGMREQKAQNALEDAFRGQSIDWTRDFTSHPLIEELSSVLDGVKRRINKDKYMVSAVGRIPLGDDSDRSILACALQGYETAIAASVYRLAMREKKAMNSDFDIVLHQHDGWSILPREGADIASIENRMRKTIATEALKYGIVMDIEMTQSE